MPPGMVSTQATLPAADVHVSTVAENRPLDMIAPHTRKCIGRDG